MKRHTGNPELAERFVKVLGKIPGAGFLTAWFDADGISYFLQHYVRMLSAAPKFSEMLNIHGPSLTRKSPKHIGTLCYAIVLPGRKSAFRAGFLAGLLPGKD